VGGHAAGGAAVNERAAEGHAVNAHAERGAGRGAQRIASVVAALAGSLLLIFLAAPIIELVGVSGADGLRRLGTDHELRSSLALTALCATAATILGFTCGTPLAYLLARTLGLGPPGVFWAIAIAFSVMTLVSAWLFRRGTWKLKRI